MNRLISLACSLAVVALFGFAAANITSRASSTKSKTIPARQDKENKQEQEAARIKEHSRFKDHMERLTGDPTVIEAGVMSDRQREHSSRFGGYGLSTGGKKILDLLAADEAVYLIYPVGSGPVPRSIDLSDYLRDLTCQADAVVVGTVNSKASQITEEGTFVFTDYELTATEILKNNPKAPIQTGGSFIFSSAGGSVLLDGRSVVAVDYNREPLRVGESYLLYARYAPQAKAYFGFYQRQYGDTFLVQGDVLTQSSRRPMPLRSQPAKAASFLAEARAATSGSCIK